MAGGIQPAGSNPRSDYGGGSVGGGILSGSTAGKLVGALKKRGKKGGSGGSSGGGNTDDPGAPSYHSGGKVRKTGLARLKKGETVMTKGQMKKMRGKRRGGKSR